MFYTSYSCSAVQLLEECLAINFPEKMLLKIKDQALVKKEEEICIRISWNSEIITSEILEKA